MELKKILVAGLLFVATGVSVIAADPYTELGGRAVTSNDLYPRLGISRAGDESFELMLSQEMYARLKNIDPAQFTNQEGPRGNKKAVSSHVVRLVKEIYQALEDAAFEGRAGGLMVADEGTERNAAAISWFSNHRSPTDAARKIKGTLAKRRDLDQLRSDNAASIAKLKAKITWELLEDRESAKSLVALNGTPGALRPATAESKSATGFENAQAACDAYYSALAKKGSNDAEGIAEMKAALAKAAALKVGKKQHGVEVLATMNKPENAVARARYEAMKKKISDRVEAAVSTATGAVVPTNSGRFGEETIKELVRQAGRGKLKPLQFTTSMKALSIARYDQVTLEALDPGVFANALIMGLLEMNRNLIDCSRELRETQEEILKTREKIQQAELDIRAATLASALGGHKATGGGSGKATPTSLAGVDDDGMALFSDD